MYDYGKLDEDALHVYIDCIARGARLKAQPRGAAGPYLPSLLAVRLTTGALRRE